MRLRLGITSACRLQGFTSSTELSDPVEAGSRPMRREHVSPLSSLAAVPNSSLQAKQCTAMTLFGPGQMRQRAAVAPKVRTRHHVSVPPRRPLTRSELADFVDQIERISEGARRLLAFLKQMLKGTQTRADR